MYVRACVRVCVRVCVLLCAVCVTVCVRVSVGVCVCARARVGVRSLRTVCLGPVRPFELEVLRS